MNPNLSGSCTAFAGKEQIASGKPAEVARSCKQLADAGDNRILLIFDDVSAEPVELDLRGSMGDVLARLSDSADSLKNVTQGGAGSEEEAKPQTTAPRSPGRPKLGVVGREVTLLPRHWEWLSAQPGGASVALRKLVEQARRVNRARDLVRSSQEVAFRFMSAMAGDEPGFEEASRALFAGDQKRFEEETADWPADVREYALSLAADAFPPAAGTR